MTTIFNALLLICDIESVYVVLSFNTRDICFITVWSHFYYFALVGLYVCLCVFVSICSSLLVR